MSDKIDTDLTLEALDMAIKRRNPGKDLILHSDRGVQYASGRYQKRLDLFGIECSMSRKGDCWDNAVMERFFWSLKQEWVYGKKQEQPNTTAQLINRHALLSLYYSDSYA